MSPGLLYIRYIGLIIPIGITLSFALFFISIKVNVVSSREGNEWNIQPGPYLLFATACVNLLMAMGSVGLFMLRDEDMLPPRLRWTSAVCGLVTRVVLVALVVVTVVLIALDANRNQFRKQELILAFITLGLLLVCLIVGIVRKLQAMRAANAAGEEEVRKEILKRLEAASASRSNSAVSTPKMYPASLRADSMDELPPFYLKYSNEKHSPYAYIN